MRRITAHLACRRPRVALAVLCPRSPRLAGGRLAPALRGGSGAGSRRTPARTGDSASADEAPDIDDGRPAFLGCIQAATGTEGCVSCHYHVTNAARRAF